MKKRALRKDFYMELRKSFPRFLSILLIAFLGVAFFSGVRAAEPDMKLSADWFYDRSSLMDIRVAGTLGLTEEDAEALKGIEGVRTVMPAYTADVLCDIGDNQLVVRMMSAPDTINKITVAEGRMPEKADECLSDTRFLEKSGFQIGDRVTVQSGTKDDIHDSLKETEYTIVGSGSTSYYLSLERGTTTIGSGELSSFLVIPEESFSLKAYTDIYLEAEGAEELVCYEDSYEDLIDRVEQRVKKIKGGRCEARFEEVKNEADEKISDAEKQVRDGEKKLADGRRKLTDGEKELSDGKKKLVDSEKELRDARAVINEKERELSDGRNELSREEEELKLAEKTLKERKKELSDGKTALDDGSKKTAAGRKELKVQETELGKKEKVLLSQEAELKKGEEELEKNRRTLQVLKSMAAAGDTSVLPQIAALEEGIRQGEMGLTQGREDLRRGKAQLAEAKQKLAQTDKKLTASEEALKAKAKELSAGEKELQKAERMLTDGRKELEKARKQLNTGAVEIRKAKTQLEDGEKELADGKIELQNSEKKLSDARKEFEDKEKKALKDISDAKKKIADGRKEISEIERPKWYILDRNSIQTYVEYGQDTERIGAIGKVFPVIFFLVAALVSLTTMTRMVEEERTQIGTLKALGYGKWEIARKYLYYALTASILGSIAGVVVGQKLLPMVIIQAYKILYNNLPDILTPLHMGLSAAAAAAAVFATVAAAMLACYKELMSVPAELMRPAAPKAGKRVLLERFGILWRHLSFIWKATVRNLFRYKKRFFMTVLGIGGCTALLLVGYGLKDSILSIGTLQFGQVMTYDAGIGIDEKANDSQKKELLRTLSDDSNVKSYMEAGVSAVDVQKGKEERSAYLVVPKEPEKLRNYINLQDRTTGKKYELKENGAVISEKLARLLNVEAGDRMILKQSDTKEVKVRIAAVAENYFNHYVYVTPSLYEKLYGEKTDFNMIYTKNKDTGETFENQFQKKYMEEDAASDVSFISGTSQRIADMLKSMDTIIYVLVISAGMLAFVVLYNLNNINISERVRELATLKVLGFYDMEVSAYVFRENIMLSLIGTLAGLVMGVFLHRYVIVTAEIEILMFGRNIELPSFLISIALTMLFSLIVNIVMYFKLRNIDMVESMKSVE